MGAINLDAGSWLNLTSLFNHDGVEFWGPTFYPQIPFSDDDTFLQVNQQQSLRIDNLANEFYGDPQLMWIILQANNIDLPNQIYDGLILRIPSIDTVNQILSTPPLTS